MWQQFVLLCIFQLMDGSRHTEAFALAYQYNCPRLTEACLEFITTSNVIDAVAETQGYKDLKTTCPSALTDAFCEGNLVKLKYISSS
jgi:speckle-type POZ protein